LVLEEELFWQLIAPQRAIARQNGRIADFIVGEVFD
jgi:hypothetical protein